MECRFTKNLFRIVALAFCIIACTFQSLAQESPSRSQSYEKGRLEATEDVKKGVYVIKIWGLSEASLQPFPTEAQFYDSILKEKYGIVFVSVGECLTDDETIENAQGYNSVSQKAIDAKYGAGILEKVRRQAAVDYEAKYGEQQRTFNRELERRLKERPPSEKKNVKIPPVDNQ